MDFFVYFLLKDFVRKNIKERVRVTENKIINVQD